MNNDLLNLSLKQGKEFNKYQTKIKKHNTKINKYSSKKEGFVSLEQEQMVRPSYNGYKPVLKNTLQSSNLINKSNQQDLDELKQIQLQYDNLIQQYTNIQNKIGSSSMNTINRTGSNNPYLNKYLLFNDGTIAFVNNQGYVKLFTNEDILNSVVGKNGCPPKDFVNVDMPWTSDYMPGATIPTNPPLIVGTPMTLNQSCGNEGANVYATKLVNNINSNYIGCYKDNNINASDNVIAIPIMNSSNVVNGFHSYCSSTIDNKPDGNYGAWAAFTQTSNYSWNSQNTYDLNSGTFIGNTVINVPNVGKVGGEYLQIMAPNGQYIIINSYTISTRSDLISAHSPNSWYVLGNKNNMWYTIDRQQNQNQFDNSDKVYNINNPTGYNSYLLLVDKVGIDNSNQPRSSVNITEWNLFTNPNYDQKAMIGVPDNIGYTTFDNCQEYSINNGYKYFGLQDVQSDGSALCLVSNDLDKIKTYGDASIQYNPIPIWSSNTQGSNSIYSFVSSSGEIIIYGNELKRIWTTPNGPAECINGGSFNLSTVTATYGGNCNGNGYDVTEGNATDDVKFLLGFVNPSDAQLQYTISNSKPYGDPAIGCGKSWDTAYQCGNIWKSAHLDYGEGQNFIYDCKEETSKCVFFLILQSDGNVCLYRGSEPSDKKELIWSTQTTGQQKAPNPDWVASKGKYGRNYLKTNEYLVTEEWIGSDDGSLKLIMQKDGNLVLYTNEANSGCKLITNKTYGLNGINAVYELNELGDNSTLGKIGYIDSNSELKEYPNDMLKYTNNYQLYPNTWINGNDLATLSTSDQQSCQSACNDNDDCAAYAYQSTNKTCWLKNSQTGDKQPIDNVFLGVRKSGLKTSNSCSNKIVDIDTIQYNNYNKGSEMTTNTECNTFLISQEDQIEYDNIKSQLITLGNDIVNKMENLYNQDKKIFQKLDTTNEQFKKDLENYKLTNMKIQKELNLQSNNIEGMQNLNINDLNGILSDSDIRVLQENYSYIMWSILAVGILIITINTIHK